MIPAKKGQTALEYLLIVVVSVVLVIGILLWVASTGSVLESKGAIGACKLLGDFIGAGSTPIVIDSQWPGGPCGTTDYDGIVCIFGSCPCPSDDCTGYEGYIIEFTSGDFSGQSFRVKSVCFAGGWSSLELGGFIDSNAPDGGWYSPGSWDLEITSCPA